MSGATTAPPTAAQEEHPQRKPVAWVALLLAGLFAIAGFVALGMWQVNRLAWKTDLIERVDQRLKAPPAPAPGQDEWQALNQANAEYLRVELTGRYAHDRETLVQASTALGSGYWVLTPMQTDRGFWVLVNRGFVPQDKRDPSTRPPAGGGKAEKVEGLLRLTEPKGSPLQANDPAAGRWYSRDVAAIAAARGLEGGAVAPYFVDATARNDAPLDWPRAGLTVLHFSNNHLMYALTWFTLAAMAAAAIAYAVAIEHRAQRRRASAASNPR